MARELDKPIYPCGTICAVTVYVTGTDLDKETVEGIVVKVATQKKELALRLGNGYTQFTGLPPGELTVEIELPREAQGKFGWLDPLGKRKPDADKDSTKKNVVGGYHESCFFRLGPRLARPRLVLVRGDHSPVRAVEVSLEQDTVPFPLTRTNDEGVAFLEDTSPGMQAGGALVRFDHKAYRLADDARIRIPDDDVAPSFFKKVVELALPSVKVVADGKGVPGVGGIKLEGSSTHYAFDHTDPDGLAALKTRTQEGGVIDGVLPATYQLTLAGVDAKKYVVPAALEVQVKDASKEALVVTLQRRARPEIEVVWGADKVIEKVGVKLRKDPETVDLGPTSATGIAALDVNAAGLLPGDHVVELVFDAKVYQREAKPLPLTLAEGFTGKEKVKLIKLARPKLRVVDETTGVEIAAVGVSLVPAEGAKQSLGETRNSGFAELAADAAGVPPGKYTLELAADRFAPALVSPATVDLAEGSVETIVVKARAAKGSVLFTVNRYDGLSVADRVTFTLAKELTPTVEAARGTTAEREVELEKENTRKVKVKEDFHEVKALDPGVYELSVPSLKTALLDKHGAGWRLGPDKDGKVKVKVEAGKTAEVAFTLTKYTKAQFIAFNIQPGFKAGHRCPTCFAQYTSPGTCTNSSCASAALLSKRCADCGRLYPDDRAWCLTCAKAVDYVCTTCNTTLPDSEDCTTCGSAAEFACWPCGKLFAGPGRCPRGCNEWLTYYCSTCDTNLADGGTCSTCSTPVELACDGCDKIFSDPGPCPKHGRCWGEEIYLGHPTDIPDLLARCLVMKKAIQTAYLDAHVKKLDADTLKIFMAPEFYFRGVDGAYQVELLSMIMDQMREETRKDVYKDWLFVFGTAIGYLKRDSSMKHELRVTHKVTGAVTKIHVAKGAAPHGEAPGVCLSVPRENATLPSLLAWRVQQKAKTPTRIRKVAKIADASGCGPGCPLKSDPSAEEYLLELRSSAAVDAGDECHLLEANATEIFNVALMQKGGPDANIASLRDGIVYKEKISHIDFARNAKTLDWDKAEERKVFVHQKQQLVVPTEGASETLSRRVNPVGGELTATGLGGGKIITIDGVTVGLEVCLDHNKALLKAFYAPSNPKRQGAPLPQIHLIPSWGASITKASLCGMVGTLVFNVDGPDGSDGGVVSGLSPGSITPLAHLTPSTAVPAAAKQDVQYKDAYDLPTDPLKTAADVDPDPTKLFQENKHKVLHTGTGLPDGHGWIDVFAPKDIPEAKTVP